MSESDPSKSLAPLVRFPFGSVPKAGYAELVEYRGQQSRGRRRAAGYGALTLLTMFLMWWGLPLIWYLPAFFVLLVCTYETLSAVLGLVFGTKTYQALPSGTSEQTALLEDDLHKEMRAWNERAMAWNGLAEAWRAAMREWRERNAAAGSDAAACPEVLRFERETLELRRNHLKEARGRLHRRKQRIEDGRRALEAVLERENDSEPAPER